MSGVIVTLFLCGPAGCEESTRTFPQFESCVFVQQMVDAIVEKAGPDSWGECREVE
jgi:hypothetical protein